MSGIINEIGSKSKIIDGKIGIGTSSPSEVLDIVTSAATSYIQFTNSDNANNWIGLNTDTMRFFNNNINTMTFDNAGNVGIKVAAPRKDLEISNATAGVGSIIGGVDQDLWLHADAHMRFTADTDNSSASDFIFYTNGSAGGNEVMRIANGGTVTIGAGTVTSDERLKENITTITGGLETINALTGRTFTWKEEAVMQTGTQYGLIAQEVEGIVPDLVYNDSGIRKFDKDGNLKDDNLDLGETDEYAKSISSTGLIPILVEAVKELSTKVTALENA